MRPQEKIVILACPDVSRGEEARLQIKAAAHVLHQRATEAHLEGMFLEGQSVRLDQLSELAEDAEIVKLRNILVDEGVLEIEVDFDVTIDCTSKGGQA